MSPTSTLSFASVTGLVLAACWGRNIPYEGGSGEEDTGSGEVIIEDTCNDDVDTSAGFYLAGTAVNLLTGETITADKGAAPLCIRAIDPTPALAGADPTDLAAAELCPNGDFLIVGLTEKPTLGMFTVIYDCNDEGTVMQTATGVSYEDFENLNDGQGVDGLLSKLLYLDTAQTWGTDTLNTTGANAEAEAYTGDLVADGFLGMFILDADENPVGNAFVDPSDNSSIVGSQWYYLDGDSADGAFQTGGTPNSVTDIDGLSMVLFPSAPIGTYEVADGGTHSWDPELFGSLPGFAVLVNIYAQ